MGAYTEIVDFTFTANETSRTFSGLSITKDDFVKVVATVVNGTAFASNIRLFPNNNTTNTNYHLQYIQANGSTVDAGRFNVNEFMFAVNGQTASVISYIKLSKNDRYNSFSSFANRLDSSINHVFAYTTSSGATFTSGITSLTLEASVTNAIGTGSRIQIYKLAAEKVADITVASNTTQVDISNLSIDKDSEYLLVSDWTSGSASGARLLLGFNDITETNYHKQGIFGVASNAGAFRINQNEYMRAEFTDKHLSYSHIKLSNIGAATFQAYEARAYGSSSVSLVNHFCSTISESITSITKLNIVSTISNDIKAGTRLTLYKLYE